MSGYERRQHPRFDFQLPLTFRHQESTSVATTENVGRHGVFIMTEHLNHPGEILQLELELPALGSAPASKVGVISVVAWSLTAAEAEHMGRQPGIGARFFMITGADKEAWDCFIDQLEAGGVPDTQSPAAPTDGWTAFGTPVSSPNGPVRLLIRVQDVDQLQRFSRRELSFGRLSIRVPGSLRLGEVVRVLLLHPETDGEFPLAGRVVTILGSQESTMRNVQIALLNLDTNIRERFDKFVTVGSLAA